LFVAVVAVGIVGLFLRVVYLFLRLQLSEIFSGYERVVVVTRKWKPVCGRLGSAAVDSRVAELVMVIVCSIEQQLNERWLLIVCEFYEPYVS